MGYSYTTGNAALDAVVWNGTTPTVLTGYGGSTQSRAYGINASGQVVGYSGSDAVVWNGTTPTVLTAVSGSTENYAFGINTSGQAVGYSDSDAVVWNGTTPTVIADNVLPLGINDSGQVVGTSLGPDGGFLYTGGTYYILHDIVVPGSGVSQIEEEGTVNGLGDPINDSGQIAATGVYEGEGVALLLTPTPEPSATMLILGSGLMWIARRHRRAPVI